MNSYVDGALVRMASYSGTVASPVGGFRDVNGNLADPTVVTFKYAPAGGTEVTVVYPAAPLVKDAVGLYHLDGDTTGSAPTAPVIWSYEVRGTGAVQAVDQNKFEVRPRNLP